MIAIETDRIFSMSSNLKLKKKEGKIVQGQYCLNSLMGFNRENNSTHLNLATFLACHFPGFWISKDLIVATNLFKKN